ncbi:saccharopine dehydrogenase NADP-binding domain-containing protein [Maridesulfovibrio sp.]|uniref:saccharopine dehydrogenase NADP-binding domain-containing protein n=1 Tax=Maridesulfovibrio sp. TaxID=2795000 RepID=UPI002A18C795|nr:saccharopine dehydrogenase NADP-binding domain-containing protein [Maridesulfovibrio sp.]
MKKIGILGGYGKVGSVAADHLAKIDGVELLIAGRNESAALNAAIELESNYANESGKSFQGIGVDVHDPSSLAAFCEQCDVVLNCTGPTALIGDVVARSAILNGAHFVDPGGYDYVLDQLEDLRDKAAEKNLNICFAAGIVPGISALLPALAAADFTEVHTLNCYFAGEDSWSYGSAYDMTCGMHELSQLGPCMIYKGEEQKLAFPERVIHFPTLPEPMGKSLAQPFYTKEFKRFCKHIAAEEARCFWVNTGLAFFLALGAVRLFKLYRSGSQIERSAKMLCRASAMDGKRRPPKGYMLCTVIKGICDGTQKTKTYWLYFPDSYTGTGLASGLMAQKIAEAPSEKSVMGFLPDMVEASEILSVLENEGIRLQVKAGGI